MQYIEYQYYRRLPIVAKVCRYPITYRQFPVIISLLRREVLLDNDFLHRLIWRILKGKLIHFEFLASKGSCISWFWCEKYSKIVFGLVAKWPCSQKRNILRQFWLNEVWWLHEMRESIFFLFRFLYFHMAWYIYLFGLGGSFAKYWKVLSYATLYRH